MNVLMSFTICYFFLSLLYGAVKVIQSLTLRVIYGSKFDLVGVF